MSQMQLQPDDPIRPLDWRKLLPFKPATSSDNSGFTASRVEL